MLDALDKDTLSNNIHFPSTTAKFAAQRELFSRGGHNPLRGCVSAIDGIALRICRPRVCEVSNHSSYWTRKGFFAINVQAAVGGDYQVHFLSKVTAGSCHDSTAFSTSGLAELLAREDGLPREYWVAGDDAYIAGEFLLTPWPGNNLLWEKDTYHNYDSSSRTFVEQVPGQIVGTPAVTHTAGVPAGRLAGRDKQAAGLAVAVGGFRGWKGRGPSAVDSTPPGRPQNIPIRASKGMTCPNLTEIGSGRGRGFSLVVFPTPLLLV